MSEKAIELFASESQSVQFIKQTISRGNYPSGSDTSNLKKNDVFKQNLRYNITESTIETLTEC